MDAFRELVLLLGAALIALGVGLIYVPAGVIVSGIILIALAVLDGYDDTNQDDEGSGDAR